MISDYLLSRQEVAEALTEKGCEALQSPLPEHSAWRSPWGDAFFVPEVGPDSRTVQWKFLEILAAVDASKPECH